MTAIFKRCTDAALALVQPYDSSGEAPSAQVWPYLKSHILPLRRVLLLSICITVFAASIEVWLISYAGWLIDVLAATPASQIWDQHGYDLLFAALIVLLLRPASQFIRHAVNDIGFQCNAATLFRWRAHEHISQQSVGWFQQDLTGRTATRLVDIGNYASDVIFHLFNTLAFGLVYMVGIVMLMAGTDVRLALPLFFWLALYIGLMVFVIPRMVRAQQKFQSAKSALVGHVVDSFSNFDTLKLFADHESIVKDHKADLENTRRALFVTRKIGVSLRTTITVLEGVIMVGFVGYAILLWSKGAASIGIIGATVALSLRITTMAEWILDSVWVIFQRVGSLREALKTVAQPTTIPIKAEAPLLEVSGGEITITNVRHHYGLDRGGLNDVSLTIGSGEKVGLVGRSGAGKSTLVNLILRFFETESGEIEIDGQEIGSVDQDSLRAAIGMVSQQAALLHRSVRDNIALGRGDITFDQIIKAANEARAHDFIIQLKDNAGRSGYDAHVGERGVKLSGGQRQRIALARVILKDAPILILDEATSALDSDVEAEIQQSLQAIMRDKTVIAIAHRLSTISQMDRILVIDDGKIVEQGSHEKLLSADTLYAKFWNRQSGGFIGLD
ncbi:MAG: ABC transporter ATP-binding protein [Granulosicoccus sp.]